MIKNGLSKIGPLLFGLLFVLMGGFFMFIFAQTTELNCTRLEPGLANCVKKTSIFGYQIGEEELNGITGAFVDINDDGDGDDTYRVHLAMRGGEEPLTGYYTSDLAGKQAISQEINRFIDVGDPSTIDVSDGASWWALIAISVFPLVGIIVIRATLSMR